MGLIRITGGVEGLAEYLRIGEKKGRRHSRDELDERVVISGDLDLTEAIITSMATEGDRFLHITISLKEDSVSLETLQGIVLDFKEFAFSAYRDDEFNVYAEAHLPRIKSLPHELLGGDIARLPHVHICVPKINLLTGETLNPFGWTPHCLRHIDAFQEIINHKYGLASPKENRRNGFFERSEILSRTDGSEFHGRGEQLKFKILLAMIEREISSMTDFRVLLKEFGDVKIQRHGQENEYSSLRQATSKKRVELLDHVFSPSFIRLPVDQKKTFLIDRYSGKKLAEADCGRRLASALTGFKDSISSSTEQRKSLKNQILAAVIERDITTIEQFRGLLDEFGTHRTRNPGRADEYENVTPPGSQKGVNLRDYEFTKAFLDLPLNKKKEHIAKQQNVRYEEAGAPRKTPDELLEVLKEWESTRAREIKYLNSGNRKLWNSYRKASPEERAEILDGLEKAFSLRLESLTKAQEDRLESTQKADPADLFPPSLSESDHRSPGAQISKNSETLQQDSVSDRNSGKTESAPENKTELLSPAAPPRPPRKPKPETGRLSDSMLGQLIRDLDENAKISGAEKTPLMSEIKSRLSGHHLLHALSKTHGLMMEKYEVVKWKDGSDRILCGSRNYPVNDFLTKEMHLSWSAAEAILRAEYTKQRQNQPEPTPRRPPDQVLWNEFANVRPAVSTREWQESQETQKISHEKRRSHLKDWHDELATEVLADTSLGANERDAALSQLNDSRIEHETALEKKIAAQIEEARTQKRRRSIKAYREWLMKQAEEDERALYELRRINTQRVMDSSAKCTIMGQLIGAPIYFTADYDFKVHENGDVTYHRDGLCAFRDTEKSVLVYEMNDLDIEIALRLAIAKFGYKLALIGSKEFQVRVVEVVAKKNLRAEFDDPDLNEILQSRRDEIEEVREGIPIVHDRNDGDMSTVSDVDEVEDGVNLPGEELPGDSAPGFKLK